MSDSEVILGGYKFTTKGDQVNVEQDIDFRPLDFVTPLVSVNKEEFEAMYPKEKETDFTFTKSMVQGIIDELGNHTVASNGHNNDDVITMINNLEAMIDE